MAKGDIQELAEALRRDPRSTTFFPLAAAYLSAGRLDDGIAVLQKGLTHHPAHAQARMLLGRALAKAERWGLAPLEGADAAGDRPRGVGLTPHKQKDAGADAMRRSAAVERDYLGDMLSRGLLDVPNVTARARKVRSRGGRVGAGRIVKWLLALA